MTIDHQPSPTIRPGDWVQFQEIRLGALVTSAARVVFLPDHPEWLWADVDGGRIVADSDGVPVGTVVIVDHKPAELTDRVARAIADADGNSRPGCVYVKLAEAAMAAGGAK